MRPSITCSPSVVWPLKWKGCAPLPECITSPREAQGGDQSKLPVVVMAAATHCCLSTLCGPCRGIVTRHTTLMKASHSPAPSCCNIFASNIEAPTDLRGPEGSLGEEASLNEAASRAASHAGFGTNTHSWALRPLASAPFLPRWFLLDTVGNQSS